MLLFLYKYSLTDADKAVNKFPTDSHGGQVGVRILGKVMKVDNAEKVARMYDSLVRHRCAPSVHHCKAGIRLNYFESLER